MTIRFHLMTDAERRRELADAEQVVRQIRDDLRRARGERQRLARAHNERMRSLEAERDRIAEQIAMIDELIDALELEAAIQPLVGGGGSGGGGRSSGGRSVFAAPYPMLAPTMSIMDVKSEIHERIRERDRLQRDLAAIISEINREQQDWELQRDQLARLISGLEQDLAEAEDVVRRLEMEMALPLARLSL